MREWLRKLLTTDFKIAHSKHLEIVHCQLAIANRQRLDDLAVVDQKLADLKHCYEQCEIDRQAIADERNEAQQALRALVDRGFPTWTNLQQVVCHYCGERFEWHSVRTHKPDCSYVAAEALIRKIDENPK